MRHIIKEVKNFIRETDKILLLLCILSSAFGCVAVLSSTLWTVGEGEKISRDFIVMVAAVSLGIIISMIISLIDYTFLSKCNFHAKIFHLNMFH